MKRFCAVLCALVCLCALTIHTSAQVTFDPGRVDAIFTIAKELDPYCEGEIKATDVIANAHRVILSSNVPNKDNLLELSQRLRGLNQSLHHLYRNYPNHMVGKPPSFNLIAALYSSARLLRFDPEAAQAFVRDSFKKQRNTTSPQPVAQDSRKVSKADRFLTISTATRSLIKRSDESILQVSVGGDGGDGWVLIVEVARGTATQYARTVGDNALYIMELKFAEFGPANFKVEVQRAGTPWDSKKYVSTIWKGIKRKGSQKVEWEQVLSDR